MKRKIVAIALLLALAMPKVASATAGIRPLNTVWLPVVTHNCQMCEVNADAQVCLYSNCIKATQPSPIPTVLP